MTNYNNKISIKEQL